MLHFLGITLIIVVIIGLVVLGKTVYDVLNMSD